MNQRKSWVLEMIIRVWCVCGALMVCGGAAAQEAENLCSVEILHIYATPEYYCLVAEDISSGERFIIETTNNSISFNDGSNDFVEIFPREPDKIHIGDTLQVEIAPKYKFMESLIGVSYLHNKDNPAYHYREISAKHNTQPWPKSSPTIKGLRYIPNTESKKDTDVNTITTDYNTNPVFKESDGIFIIYLVDHVKINDLKESDKFITKVCFDAVITSEGDLVNPVIIDSKTKQPKDSSMLNSIERAYLNFLKCFPKGKWIPAMKDGKPVSTLMRFPIHIHLQ